MHRDLLAHFNRELFHLRQTASEFAREFPKIAGRLSLDKDAKEGCPDPFVERLLEGFAYMTARVQLKLDAEFPRFTQSLIETVYPHYLCPTPSMAVVRLDPDPQEAGKPEGFRVERGSKLRAVGGSDETPCEFRTAHPVTVWPFQVVEGRYFTRDIGELQLPSTQRAKAAFRLRLRTNAGAIFKKLDVKSLPVFVRGLNETPGSICEQIFSQITGVIVKTSKANGNVFHSLPASSLRRIGMSEQEALLPYAPRGFEGYRLLQEYFALPERFRFFEFTQLAEAFQKCNCEELDLIILLRESEPRLENLVDARSFELFCTPAINLFEKRLDPISLTDRFSEYQLIADRTTPIDYEIYHVEEVEGLGTASDGRQHFRPFYQVRDLDLTSAAYFSANRVPRVVSAKERQFGVKSSYAGSEVYLSLVDANAAPYRSDLVQLFVKALCTNRHLPIRLSPGAGKTDFQLDLFAPVSSIRCVAGPTLPRAAHPVGEYAWRAISHLSLNYLSMIDSDGAGAAALRDLLRLYVDDRDSHLLKQIEGLRSITSRPIIRRVESPGPLTFGRGVEITLEFDEHAFEGTGTFTLGSVLEQFFARYVSLNSFTETVIRSQQRGEIIRWPAQIGKRQIA